MTPRANTFVRKKEPATGRRERRARADARVFQRLVKAGKAVSMHHNKAPPLYHVLHLYINAGFVDVTNDKSHASNA